MLERLQHRLNLYSGGLEYLEYVPGGTQASVVTVNTYDAVALTWTILSSLPAPHDHVGGAIVADKLYVISGRQNFTVADPVYAMDLAASQLAWTSKVQMPTARGGLSFGVIGKRIFSFGGEGNPDPGSKGVLNEPEMYDVRSNMWIKLEPMQYPRHGTCAASGIMLQNEKDLSLRHSLRSMDVFCHGLALQRVTADDGFPFLQAVCDNGLLVIMDYGLLLITSFLPRRADPGHGYDFYPPQTSHDR